MFPILIINRKIASVEKKLSEQGAIVFKIRSPEDLTEGVMQFTNIMSSGKMLVFSDIALGMRNANRLLKFVEETKNNFVAVSSDDFMNRTLLSRFKSVRKFPDIVENEGNGMLEELPKDSSIHQRMQAVVKGFPTSFETNYYLRRCRLPNKESIGRMVM